MLSVRQRWWLVMLAAIATASLTARLGWWQLDRAAQKIALQATLDERAKLPPIDGAMSLAATVEAASAQLDRRVRLVGRWSAAHTVYLDNRQMNERPGFFVVTPLLLADGTAVLVQRGWLPRDVQQRSRIAQHQFRLDQIHRRRALCQQAGINAPGARQQCGARGKQGGTCHGGCPAQ